MATQHPAGAKTEAVRGVLAPVVEGLGLVLEDVVVQPAGSRRLLRVVLDLPPDAQGSLSLDAVAEASRAVSTALDEAEPMGGAAYVLEVTSPGVDRPLTEPRHFARNVRRLVRVHLADGSEVEGRVAEAATALVLSVAGPKKGMSATREIDWSDVVRGLVQVEFTRPDGAGDAGAGTDTDAEIGD